MLTSETLEHVPDLEAALGEIHRVLAPGGRHVFTIPLLPGVPETFARSIVLPDGSIQDRSPRISHPGGDWGYPVFTEFGADLPALLERAGFETDVFYGPVREDDLAQVYVCRKASRLSERGPRRFTLACRPGPSKSEATRATSFFAEVININRVPDLSDRLELAEVPNALSSTTFHAGALAWALLGEGQDRTAAMAARRAASH